MEVSCSSQLYPIMTQNQSCLVLLAVTAKKVCPFLVPIEGASFDDGFYYDFLALSECDEAICPLIMQEMRRACTQKIPIVRLTMMPKNAASFLKESQPLLASRLDMWPENLVELCKIESFYDICLSDTVETCAELQEFSLYEVLFLDAEYPFLGKVKIARIRGVVSPDKKALKRRLKLIELAKKQDPVQVAQAQDLLFVKSGEVLWLPRGMEVYFQFEEMIKTACRDRTYSFVSGLKRNKDIFLKREGRFVEIGDEEREALSQDYEGLFLTKNFKSISFALWCTQEQLEKDCNSALQFMQKIATILGLDAVAREKKNGIVLEVADLRGRKWPLSLLEWTKNERVYLRGELILSLERAIGLVLERHGGKMPFWLAPEQVRIVPVASAYLAKAESIQDACLKAKIRAHVDASSATVAQKVYTASQQKIPIAIVVGEREVETGVVQLRTLESQRSHEMREQECIDAICKSIETFQFQFTGGFEKA